MQLSRTAANNTLKKEIKSLFLKRGAGMTKMNASG
jgi:hypothetical protein